MHFGIGSASSRLDELPRPKWRQPGRRTSPGESRALGLDTRAYALMNLPFTYGVGVLTAVLFPAMARLQLDRDRLRRAYVLMTSAHCGGQRAGHGDDGRGGATPDCDAVRSGVDGFDCSTADSVRVLGTFGRCTTSAASSRRVRATCMLSCAIRSCTQFSCCWAPLRAPSLGSTGWRLESGSQSSECSSSRPGSPSARRMRRGGTSSAARSLRRSPVLSRSRSVCR